MTARRREFLGGAGATLLLLPPGGATGSVAVTFTGRADPATGVLRSAERLVLTRLGESEQRIAEQWTLTPL